MNAVTSLCIALNSYGPLEYTTPMLSADAAKVRFAANAEPVVAGIAGLMDMTQSPKMATLHPGLILPLIAPPPVQELASRCKGIGATAKGLVLAFPLKTYAPAREV